MYSSNIYRGNAYSGHCGNANDRYSGTQQTNDEYSRTLGNYTRPMDTTPEIHTRQDIHDPTWFLNEDRQPTPTIENTTEIMPLIQETFKTLTDQELPANIKITILDSQMLKTMHEHIGGSWSEGIQGFSINRWNKGISEIYAKEAEMDSLMLTIGHEIGHVLTPPLTNIKDEEAKAFAFSIAWTNTIKKHNIGNIAGNFIENPAQNGIHDTGLQFVRNRIEKGLSAARIYIELVKQAIGVEKTQETIFIS